MLEAIKQPSDLRQLSGDQLVELAAAIREFLVRAVATRGGHLGPNLGVVELTIALHRAFDSPVDRIVWDTGHQAYVHKLLTGRQADFAGLRTMGGLSGYPSRSESPHDVIENSHASTALGYALGLAEARRAGRGEGRVIAVVGDGSLTGGVALEALNLIGARKPDLLVILNDNGRSYQPTVGGLAGHLAPLRLHPGYEAFKKGVEVALGGVPLVGEGMLEAAKRVKEGAKAMVATPVVFEDLGWQYAGPVDGHDIAALERALDHVKRVTGPVILHVTTEKGRGYAPSEQHEEDKHHSVGAFDPSTGKALAKAGDEVQLSKVFGQALLEQARRHPELVAISAAMVGPTKLSIMASEFPDRVYDVGIAEQVGVTMAAGMAMRGLRPLCAIYSTFLQRAFDQVMMDVSLHRLPVVFAIDRAGITGDDGPSHHGVFDLTYLRQIPGMVVAAPRDGTELRRMLATAMAHTAGPFAIRFAGKLAPPKVDFSQPLRRLKIGNWEVRSRGSDVLLLGLGALHGASEEAARLLRQEGISVTLVDPRWVKPLDPRLASVAGAHRLVVTVEDNVLAGGFGAAVAEVLADEEVATPLLRLGVPDQFLQHGKRDALLAELGLDAVGVAERVRKRLHRLEQHAD
ncbi:MAG TPA: 1-deoxy-D-xylulose-5-phosphate synthase [Actinomycetes bacterium]|jgi:1-deoxy-D-xylulose-5-phosphate synthase|nr:1-deoxy-D-xylulose-5-phosphate synthase [Actinomycetes bacterium]